MLVPTVEVASQINQAINEVKKQLWPSVQNMRYELGNDWNGQLAIFFRVLLSDDASKPNNLRQIAPIVVWSISGKIDLPGLGLFPYFDFRSQSEQAEFREPAWA